MCFTIYLIVSTSTNFLLKRALRYSCQLFLPKTYSSIKHIDFDVIEEVQTVNIKAFRCAFLILGPRNIISENLAETSLN